MQPLKIKAWACGHCGHMYSFNDIGQKSAELCCRCTNCGGPGTSYTGQGNLCKRCHMVNVLARYRAQHETVTADLADIEAKAKALGINT
jgi:hypothetical protein